MTEHTPGRSDLDLDAALGVARDLARAAGDLAVREQDRARVSAKSEAGDVVTHVDQEAERLIVAGIRDRYPDHAILGEESGFHAPAHAPAPGTTPMFRWLVDPLDGTNDYVLDIDVFGVCMTLLRDDEPVLAVIHDSPRRRTLWAIAGRGAHLGSEKVHIAHGTSLDRATVSWLQGYAVDREDPRRDRAFTALERSCKRTLRTWCPSLDWRLLATGRTAGLIAYRNEAWDLAGGVLIAREAGAAVVSDESGAWIVLAAPDLLSELTAVIGLETGPQHHDA